MTDTWTWATVTQASRLRIKVDGDTTALDATTDNLVGSLAVDDRVRVHLHADGIIVTGIQGGGTPEATAATANTLALRDGSGQLKAADGVADDDVATVGQLYDDTGWVSISTPSGWTANRDIAVRKIGIVVYWRGRLTPNSSKSGTVSVLASGVVPAWARPLSIYDSMRVLNSSESSGTAESAFKNGTANTNGTIVVWYGSSNTDPINLAGLSGYISE